MCATVCALTFLSTLPAFAQYPGYGPYAPSHQWVVTYKSVGTSSYDALTNRSVMENHPSVWPVDANGQTLTPGSADVDATASGSVTATLDWWPTTGQTPTTDPPPKLVYIRETATAYERHGGWAGSGPAPDAGSVSNGWGDPVVTEGHSHSCTGTHLLQRDGSSGHVVLDPVALSASCPQTNYLSTGVDWMWTDTIVVSLDVQIDPRSVVIHRNGARQTGKVTGLHGEHYGEWVDPDGTGHGDTTYSYTVSVDVPLEGIDTFTDKVNWQTFEAMFSDGWPVMFDLSFAPDVTWSWNPNASDDTWAYAKWSMVHGNINVDNGDLIGAPTGPIQRTMTYTATDNRNPDHATATAHYVLTVHDDIEWSMDANSPQALAPNLVGAVDHAVSAGSDVIVQYSPPRGTLDYSDGVRTLAIVTGVAAAISIPASDGASTAPATAYIQTLLAGISAAAGSSVPSAKTDQKTFSSSEADFEKDVATQASKNSGDTSNIDFPDTNRFDDLDHFVEIQSNPVGSYSGVASPGYWTVTAQAIEHRANVSWTGMRFDEAGYAGLTHSHANYRTRIDDKCVRTWHFNPTAIPIYLPPARSLN